MMRFRTLLLALALSLPVATLRTGCGGKKDASAASADADNSSENDSGDDGGDLLPLPAIQPGEAFSKDFEGKISKDLTIRMHLDYTGQGSVSGWYYYRNIGAPILLYGSLDDNMNLELKELTPNVGETGAFKGRFKSNNYLEGSWKGNNGKTLNMALEEIDFGRIVEVRKLERKPKKGEVLEISVDIEYPYFIARNPEEQEKYEKLNKILEDDAQKSFKTTVQDFEAENKQVAENPEVIGIKSRSHLVNYSIYFQSDELISILHTGDTYMGGAHGLPFAYVTNYDLKADKKLEIDDILNLKNKGLEKLAQYCHEELTKLFEGEYIAEGALPEKDNYSALVLTPGGLYVQFLSYQVAPYAAGTPMISVPYEKISGAMQAGVLSRVKGNK